MPGIANKNQLKKGLSRVKIKSIQGKRIQRDPVTGKAIGEQAITISPEEARRAALIAPSNQSGNLAGKQKLAAQAAQDQLDIQQTQARRSAAQEQINILEATQALKKQAPDLFKRFPQPQANIGEDKSTASKLAAGAVSNAPALIGGAGAAIGLGLGSVGTAGVAGVAGLALGITKLTLGQRQDVKNAYKNYQIVKPDFANIINQINTNPNYSIEQAAEDWIRAEDTMYIAQSNLEKRTRSAIGAELSGAEDELIAVTHFNEVVLPNLRAQFEATLLNPNPTAQAFQLPQEQVIPNG